MFCPFMSTKNEKAECSIDCALIRIDDDNQHYCAIGVIAGRSTAISNHTSNILNAISLLKHDRN